MFGLSPDSHDRIDCISQIRTAYIIYKGIAVAEISEERNDADEFDWVVKPYYDVIDKIGGVFITGIDLDLRQEEYIRRYVPGFVSRRTMPDNRINLHEELEAVGLTWNDRFEYMCRTGGRTNSSYTVSRTREPQI